MNPHRIILGVELIFIVLPLLMLSGIWFIGHIGYTFDYVGTGNGRLVLRFIHLILSVIAFLATVATGYIAVQLMLGKARQQIKYMKTSLVFVKFGLLIVCLGLAFSIYQALFGLHGDEIQMFSTYLFGLPMVIPAIHVLKYGC